MKTGHRLFCKEFLCFTTGPVVTCPYLCTSDPEAFLRALAPSGGRPGFSGCALQVASLGSSGNRLGAAAAITRSRLPPRHVDMFLPRKPRGEAGGLADAIHERGTSGPSRVGRLFAGGVRGTGPPNLRAQTRPAPARAHPCEVDGSRALTAGQP